MTEVNSVYNLDLDEELLAHLPDPEAWLVLREEGFKETLIKDKEVKEIYLWAQTHLRDHSKPATASVLSDEFDLEFEDPQTAIGDLIDRLRQRYMKESGREALKEIGEKYNEDPLQIGKVLVQKGKMLGDLLVGHGEAFGTGDFDRAKDHYYIKARTGRGPSFGFEEVDDYLFGQRGVTCFLGLPKSGKSWFMINGVISNIRQGHYPWLYSLELPAEEADMRLRCMWSDIPWYQYLRFSIHGDEWDHIKERSEMLDELGAYRILSPKKGDRDLYSLVGKAQDAGADVVFIDQLQYVETGGRSLGGWNKTERYWEVLDLARELSYEIPICFAHQFNRSAWGSDAMPGCSQSKGSEAMTEIPTAVFGIWASPDMKKSGLCQFGTLRLRNSEDRLWQVNVDLTRGCNLEIDKVIDDEYQSPD